jgi:hypothetical protein
MGILVFILFSAVLTLGIVIVHLKARRLSGDDWEALVARIQPVPFEGLEKVALDHLQPQGSQLLIEPEELWKLVGGFDGLKRMRQNADLIVQLAAHVRRWNFDESVVVAERIRQDTVLLKRALFKIKVQMLFSTRKLHVPFYVHHAASAYYLMTRRVLALYQTNQFVLYPRLTEVL